MNAVVLNIIFGVAIFIINGLLGKLQNFYKNIFEYEIFSFANRSNGSYSGNFFQMVVNPTIFITIACAVMQCCGETGLCASLWQTVLWYWAARMLFCFIMGRLYLMNWWYEACAFVLSVLLAFFVHFTCLVPLLNDGEDIFISVESLRDAVWFAILSCAVKLLWDMGKCALRAENILSDDRKERAVKQKYNSLKRKYSDFIDDTLISLQDEVAVTTEFKSLVYAVMIYENHNRPAVLRLAEQIAKKLFPSKPMTLGIMQVKTYCNITNLQSIELGIRKLYEIYSSNIGNQAVEIAICNYNGSSRYFSEVKSIFDILNRR